MVRKSPDIRSAPRNEICCDAASEEGAARAKAALASVRRLRTAGESGHYATFRASCGASSSYMAWLALTGAAHDGGPAAAYRARRGVWLTDALHNRPLWPATAEAQDAWAWSLLDAVGAAAQARDGPAVKALLRVLGGGGGGGCDGGDYSASDGEWAAAAAEAQRHSAPALAMAALDLSAAQQGAGWACGDDTLALMAADAAAPQGERALALAHTWLAEHTRIVARDGGCGAGEWRISVPSASAALAVLQLQ